MKKALIWTFVISILYSILLFFVKKYYIDTKLINSFIYLLFLAIYMWIPGIIAIIFAKKENIDLPIFKKPNKYLSYAIFLPIVISILAFVFGFLFAKFKPIPPPSFGLSFSFKQIP